MVNRSVARWWRHRGGPVALAAVLALAVGGCREKTQSPTPEPDVGETESEPDADETDPDSLEDARAAFGLPFPPKVRGIDRKSQMVKVTTRMELDDLAEFFRTRLVDYEILRAGDDQLRVVGLREFMPSIHVSRFGPISIVAYRPARETPEQPRVEDGTESDQPAEPEGDRAAGSTTSGSTGSTAPGLEELAPNAVPGEPYTPPPGSPLNRPRYKENFGKPLGEWTLP